MNNAELIEALRNCACIKNEDHCKICGYRHSTECGRRIADDAADALEAAEKRIAVLEAQMPKLPDRQEFLAKGSFIEEPLSRPKEGEWIEDDATYCGADRANYKCSLCGKIGGTWKRGLTQDELPNYCPNCGARMRGTNDEQIH